MPVFYLGLNQMVIARASTKDQVIPRVWVMPKLTTIRALKDWGWSISKTRFARTFIDILLF